MPSTSALKDGSPSRTGKRRERRSKVDARVLEHLLRRGARLDQPQHPGAVARALDVPYSTITAALRRLERAGRIASTYVVNNFRTQYCHEYQVALAVDGRAIAATDADRRERLVQLPDAVGLRDGGTAELFIEELIDRLARSPAYRDHIVVCDAIFLHGALDRDIELNILTNDGSFSLGRWIRDELTGHPCIRAVYTVTVGFRYSRNGYSGQHVNYQHTLANGLATNGEP
jgi:DNA-binding MarR family transcriptional regulator